MDDLPMPDRWPVLVVTLGNGLKYESRSDTIMLFHHGNLMMR